MLVMHYQIETFIQIQNLNSFHMADRTEKIENQHADQQIEVSGSQIQSGSDQQDEFGQREDIRQSNVKAPTYENNKAITEGGYQASDYAHLPVSQELKELFKSIQRYSPNILDIDSKLKAFIPDYIPAIGQVDAFLKMPRPDGKPQTLGLYVVDEPALNQSDKAKIDLMIRNNTNQYQQNKYTKVHSIESAQKNPKQILQWINSVTDIHKTKQPPSVSYTKRMPDIENLMQVWPQQVQDLLSEISVPSQEIDLTLEQYSRVACNILDIPVHKEGDNNVVESLHVMFTLFSAFKENQHFQQENQSFAQNA